MAEELELSGLLEKIIFSNRENAWTVGLLATALPGPPVPFVGYLPDVKPGTDLKIRGSFREHPKFGRQFSVSSYTVVPPTDLASIESYLGSGLFKGIGPSIAKRLVAKFGKSIFEVMDKRIEDLRAVSGIGQKTLAQIKESALSLRHMRDLLLFLQEHGISPALAKKIDTAYGARAFQVLNKNPYQLALDIRGIGFHKADEIAKKLGIDERSSFRIRAGILMALEQAMSAHGHTFLPADLLVKQTTELLGLDEPVLIEKELRALTTEAKYCRQKPILADSDEPIPGIYLETAYQAECEVAAHLKRLTCSPTRKTDPIALSQFLQDEERLQKIYFSPSQKKAIELSLSSKISVITGGPGTGKTTIIRSLLHFAKTRHIPVLLTAPTGRAAKRMMESTGEEAKTIHRLLEWNPEIGVFVRSADNPLDAQMIIVDESSMLDIFLVRSLLNAIQSSASVIFVGDVNQLPSVGPGNFLRDLIESKSFPVAILTDIFRQGEGSLIIENAHRMLAGEHPHEREEKDVLSDFYFIRNENSDEIHTLLLRLITDRIPKRFHISPKDIQVLSPMNKGPLGVESLNAKLQAALNSDEAPLIANLPFRKGDRVMQMKNNYELDVFNGDLGIVDHFDRGKSALAIRFDERLVSYPRESLDELALAYATTVHKSQGSEYKAILFPIVTGHYIMLKRNLIYTALTRAKKLAIFIGMPKAMEIAIERTDVDKRFSGLKALLAPPQPL